MASNTWRANAQGVAYAANKHMLDVFNSSSSSRYIRVWRMYLLNNGTASITGVLNLLQICRNTASSSGTTVTPVAHDPGNAALNANTTAGHNRTITGSTILRQVLSQNDEPTVTTLDMDALLTLVPFAECWNAGYGDTNVQALCAPASADYGYSMKSITATTGSCDVEIEFTDAAS